jgi:hypothetical protein
MGAVLYLPTSGRASHDPGILYLSLSLSCPSPLRKMVYLCCDRGLRVPFRKGKGPCRNYPFDSRYPAPLALPSLSFLSSLSNGAPRVHPMMHAAPSSAAPARVGPIRHGMVDCTGPPVRLPSTPLLPPCSPPCQSPRQTPSTGPTSPSGFTVSTTGQGDVGPFVASPMSLHRVPLSIADPEPAMPCPVA